MPDDLILMERGDSLVALEAAPYDAGAVLHDLLDAHPELLAGAQMDRSNPRRFVPLRHEALDGEWDREHLFLDQDGIPTIVEVVHSSDTAGRRDAVGRIVDYAANAGRTAASSNGTNGLRTAFHRGLPASQPAESEKLTALLGPDADIEEFWSRASRNLRQGNMRLVLVAEEITDMLQAVIEFLNQRMTDTDVFGVEIRQYSADDAPTCYVPRLVGAPSIPEEPAMATAAAEVEEVLAETMPVEAAAPAAAEAPAVAVPDSPEEEELQDAVQPEEELQDDLSGDLPEDEEEELQDRLDNEESEAVQLQNRLRSLGSDSGLECKVGAGSFSVVDRLGTLAAINTTLSTIEFWLAPVFESNPFQVTQIKNDLARVAQKALSERYPSLSAHDALANWEVVVDILDRLIEVRASANEDSSATSGGFVGQMSPPPAPPPAG